MIRNRTFADRALRFKRRYFFSQDTQETLWGVDETVWLNPPYGEFEIPEFISRAKWALRRGEAKLVCFLIPNATENVVWHQEIFDAASEICFIEGRISFIEDGAPNNKNTHGSALVFFAKERGPGKWSWIKRDDLREAGGGNIRQSRVKLG